ncbi:hypothetical protein [Leptospira noguchii]|uniref:hypothetical protein n=1 Tax=Leptospira noguchii TaxID=28182 RepID=UPI0003054D4F|nr:hypothetical protein [Leptospira noguchii]AGS80577.1 hypothetical protein LEP1GSC059_0093 [Leptospira phage vB_LnoZ_CZ214-LE1]
MNQKNGIPNYLIIVLPFLFSVTVLSLYFYHFHSQFSYDQSVWGQFGDFVGGVINPFLSFITVIYLIKSYSQQQKEFKNIILENKKNGLTKALVTIGDELKEFYKKESLVELFRKEKNEVILKSLILNAECEVELSIIESKYENPEKLDPNEVSKEYISVGGETSIIDHKEKVKVIKSKRLLNIVFLRMGYKHNDIPKYIETMTTANNRIMLHKFKIAKTLISEIYDIENGNVLCHLFLTENTLLNDLYRLKFEYF